MGHFSVEIYAPPGSALSGNQQFICKLRKKLAHACGGENYIETVWGRGYVLRELEEMAEAV